MSTYEERVGVTPTPTINAVLAERAEMNRVPDPTHDVGTRGREETLVFSISSPLLRFSA
jgi:hypothetical protein